MGIPLLAVLTVSFIAGLVWLVAEFANGLGEPKRVQPSEAKSA